MPDPCNVHDAPDAIAKKLQLLDVLDDLGEADVCGECVAVMRADGCFYPDEDAGLLRRHLGVLRMQSDYKPTTADQYELIAEALKTLHAVSEVHNFHDISTKIEECQVLLAAHITRSLTERG